MSRRAVGRTVSVMLVLFMAVPGLLPASQAAMAAPAPGTSITTGFYQTCALVKGRAYCWGPGGVRLGGGSTVPVAVDTTGALAGKTLAQVSSGDDFTCALDTAGRAYCWGGNTLGELGDGNTAGSAAPVPVNTSGVLAGKTLTQVSAGESHACVLDTAGQAYCWGVNFAGELGDGTTTDSHVPVAVDTSGVLAGKKLTKLAAGALSTCAVDASGAAYCWGENGVGELGDGTTANSTVPVTVDLPGKTLTSITGAVLGLTFCALDSSGAAYCWGNGNADVPARVGTGGALAGKTLTQVSTSGYHTCALDSTGAAYCWGNNYDGQLGDGTLAGSDLPVAVDTTGVLAGRVLTQISAGGDFSTCAADTTGAVYCWGDDSHGALGDGGPAAWSDMPVQAGPSPPASVTAVPGDRSAVVSWGAPAMPAGLAGYTAFAWPGGKLCVTTATRCTITGLTNQVTYHVTVIAHTATTNSGASAPVDVTPGSGIRFVSNRYDTAASGNAFSFTVSASGSPAPAITVQGRLPSGVTFTDHGDGTGAISGTPSPGAAGRYPLMFTAKSTAGTATQAFTLTVTRSPALAEIPATTGTVGTALNIPVTAVGYPVPVLTKFGTLPEAVGFADHGDGTGAIVGTPFSGSGGRYLISVFAASTSGVATRCFVLTIDQAPAITSASSATIATGYVFSLPVTATGYPAPEITASGSLPEGVTFNSATATLGGIPGEGTSGSYPIIITAKNAAGTITQLFTLTVTTPPEPPFIHALSSKHPLGPRIASPT